MRAIVVLLILYVIVATGFGFWPFDEGLLGDWNPFEYFPSE